MKWKTVYKKRLYSIICDWFVDNNIIIHFGGDQTKSILFSYWHNLKLVEYLDIWYKGIEIKQHKHISYLWCMLDEVSGEKMTLKLKKSTGWISQNGF